MSIVKPDEMNFSNKNIVLLIQGKHGVGKTTLALSSKRPLLIDIESGVDRVDAYYRKDTLVCDSYKQLLNDLETSDLSAYDTLILDTLGSAIDLMTPYLINQNPKFKQDTSNQLSQKGWGAVKVELKSLIQICRDKKKDLIIITHCKADKDGETTIYVPDIGGSMKDDIFNDIDLACFMETIGNKRTVNFSPTDRFSAKGNHGIAGVYEVKTLEKHENNNAVAELFKTYREELQNEVVENKNYNDLMTSVTNKIIACKTDSELNTVLGDILGATHIYSSKEELGARLNAKAKDLGFKFDKGTKTYVKS
jgi:hypothetical protein